jgi:hypothetical protein
VNLGKRSDIVPAFNHNDLLVFVLTIVLPVTNIPLIGFVLLPPVFVSTGNGQLDVVLWLLRPRHSLPSIHLKC